MMYWDEGRRTTNWIKRRHHPNHCVTGLCMQECQRRRRVGVCCISALHIMMLIIVEPQPSQTSSFPPPLLSHKMASPTIWVPWPVTETTPSTVQNHVPIFNLTVWSYPADTSGVIDHLCGDCGVPDLCHVPNKIWNEAVSLVWSSLTSPQLNPPTS